MRLFKDPRGHLILGLFLLLTISSPIVGGAAALRLLVYCVGASVIVDQIFAYIYTKKIFFPYSALITGLILALTIDTALNWLMITLISAAAIGSKYLFRVNKRHIFNPAAFGLLFGNIVFNVYPSWWALSLPKGDNALLITVLLYIVLAYIAWVSAYKYRRYFNILSYVVVFTVLFEFIIGKSGLSSLVLTIKSPGTLFYALVMLPEPMTSPVRKNSQILFGVFTAVVSIILVYMTTAGISLAVDTFLLALLLANGVFFKFR